MQNINNHSFRVVVLHVVVVVVFVVDCRLAASDKPQNRALSVDELFIWFAFV